MLDIEDKAPPPSSGRSPSPSELGEDWESYVVPQNWEAFTAEDHAVWDLLFARQVELLGSRVVSPFLDGIDLLRLSHPGVPDVEGLNAILEPRTGWRTVAVPGLVPDDVFFAMLASQVFPVGNFIRTREQLDYLEAPDCFHDMFGHIPMLAHHEYADMTRHIGELGSAAIAAGQGHKAARLYWHSVEFGLALEAGELKILGAGLASSFGEAHFSLESEAVERVPFSVEQAVDTPYKHDAFQPRYLVSESLEGTITDVMTLTRERLLAL
ncbi:phenylalanine 4-monooxygenase [Sphingomonas sp. URHD0057]|uniref:phenylalanine 4-monooxygenase n=1 Tax=Sphingomonas sp. URHD0057 TaxID=1380389 RepID=UPI0006849D53|nr:phenylalanine 4-monooxygenase [Sphingomonas sp. URHD0057]